MVSNEEIQKLLGDSCYEMYEKLDTYITSHYNMELSWSKGGKYGIYCLRYQRSKKTLCTLYFRENHLGIWIIFGKSEREKFEEMVQYFSGEIVEKYNKTENFHDGKWMMFDVKNSNLLEDVKLLLQIKKKPIQNRAEKKKQMNIIEFFTTDNKEHWLEEMKKCDWGAGKYLRDLLSENKLKSMVGETAIVPMLIDGEKIVSFCTLAPLDDIQPTELTPWIGFVYTFPEYRGHRYAGILFEYAESIATIMGKEYIYISTGHEGLYEKYGYEFYKFEKDIGGEESRIYRKNLSQESPEKEKRLELGVEY